jgi:hypothetical protein
VLDASIRLDAVRHVHVVAGHVLHVRNLEEMAGVAAVPPANNLL